jgi:hypothetical protein
MAKITPGRHVRPIGAQREKTALLFAGLLALGATDAHGGEVRCWIDKGAIIATAAFGDIAGDFVLDLARARTTLHVTRANSDGLMADTATAPLTFAGERFGARTLPILDLDPETKAFDTTVNGVLGADILHGHVLSLDLRNGGCRLALAASAPRRPKGAIVVPLSMMNGIPTVPALASDGAKVRPGVYALGTSQAPTIISAAHLSRSGAEDSPVRLRALEFAGQLHEQVPAEIRPAVAPGVAGALGLGVLAGSRTIIDENAGTLTLLTTKRSGERPAKPPERRAPA